MTSTLLRVQGFFHIPVDDLYALPILCARIEEMALPNLVVVSPDAGFAKKARKFAARLRAPLAIADKERAEHDEHAEILSVMGDVRGRTAMLVDDFAISCGTLAEAARALRDMGVTSVYAAVSHGVLAERAMETLEASEIQLLVSTNTIERQSPVTSPKIETVSIAPLFGEAIRRIHERESISVLFN